MGEGVGVGGTATVYVTGSGFVQGPDSYVGIRSIAQSRK
jgi:hypothetical protein